MARIVSTTPRDDAADAARFLTRLAYAVLAVGAPVGALLAPLAMYVLFPVGAAMLAFAAGLEPPAQQGRKIGRALGSPVVLLLLALFAWATLSIVWTPFRVEAWQQSLRYTGLTAAVVCALCLARSRARATEIYLFAAGIALIVATAFAGSIAIRRGASFPRDPVVTGGELVATLAYPALAGLAARGRDGLARGLLVLSLLFCYATGSAGVMLSFIAGFAVLTFVGLDPSRVTRSLGAMAAGVIALAPAGVLIAEPLLRAVFNSKLSSLPAPYPSLANAFTVVTRDGARLFTGHGFETLTHGVLVGALPAETPQVALFQVWYELGIVGAWLSAAIVFLAYRGLATLPARVSPFLAAALTSALALGASRANFDDWTWLMALAIALVCGDVAARSAYQTRRPSVENLARF